MKHEPDAFVPEAAADEPASPSNLTVEDEGPVFATEAEQAAYWQGVTAGIRDAGREPGHPHMPADLVPAGMESWTQEQIDRAKFSGFLALPGREQWPRSVREGEGDGINGKCHLRQLYLRCFPDAEGADAVRSAERDADDAGAKVRPLRAVAGLIDRPCTRAAIHYPCAIHPGGGAR